MTHCLQKISHLKKHIVLSKYFFPVSAGVGSRFPARKLPLRLPSRILLSGHDGPAQVLQRHRPGGRVRKNSRGK